MRFAYTEEMNSIFSKLENQYLNLGVAGIEPKRLYNQHETCLYRCNDMLVEINKDDLIQDFSQSKQTDFESYVKRYIAEKIISHTLKGSKHQQFARQNYSWN
ncbi:MAG: hypothetical protein KDD94_00560 [Calditrichaeota bacterium]|nr:hypothetical protein [Calditrichota bacterium]